MGKSDVTFSTSAMCSKELNVKVRLLYGLGNYDASIKHVATGMVKVAQLIMTRVPFEQADEAFAEMAAGKGFKTLYAGPSFSPSK
jgi:D-xylulose reductase